MGCTLTMNMAMLTLQEKSAETFDAGDSYLIHKEVNEETGEYEWVQRRFSFTTEDGREMIGQQQFGPKAFGALFFFITGFHGFHVFSGVVFLTIICINVASGIVCEAEKRIRDG
jgi:cytochrome c oxidase subunit 3